MTDFDNNHDEQTEARTKLTELIKGARTGIFTTTDEQGSLVSRPMALQTVEFDGDLWFFTSASSNKVQEIAGNPRVNVAFQSDNTWVSLSGNAEVLDDRAKAEELWNTFVKAYFPGGVEDPELRLIKVHAESAEYWDSGSKVVSLFKMAKAAATNTTPDLGENKTIEL